MRDVQGRTLVVPLPGGRAVGRLFAAIGGVALAVASAQAADNPVKGSQLLIKAGTKPSIKIQSKDAAGIPAPAADPTVVGADLEVTVVEAGGTQTETFNLPAAGWKAAGTSGFKYKGASGTPIKAAQILSAKQVKVSGAPTDLPLAGAPSIKASVVLTIGSDRYCLDFVTPPNPNTASLAKWGAQTVGGTCPVPPTTTTSTTSTTTTTAPPNCGNGTPEAGEACDDGNLVDCDGCDSNCTTSDTCGNGIVCAPEQCEGGPNCSALCENDGTTCGTASGQRLVVVSIDTPEPLAGATVTLEYPQFQTSIPGQGGSSEVASRVFVFPVGGQVAVNDTDAEVRVVLASTNEFVGSGPVFAANFDECTSPTENICNRNQLVTGCCNNAGDPTQFGNVCTGISPTLACPGGSDVECPGPDNLICTAAGQPYACCTGAGAGTCTNDSRCTAPGVPRACCTGNGTGTCTTPTGSCAIKCPANPPVCNPGTFPTAIPDGPCTTPNGGCPGDNVCVSQASITACTVSNPTKWDETAGGVAVPVAGVTCSVSIL